MSFILDALKKVEEKKRFGGEAAAGELARSTAARERRGRELLLVGAVAVASAVLTAGVLVFFSMRSGSAPSPASAGTAPPADATSASPLPAPAPEAASPAVPRVRETAPAPPRRVPARESAPVPAAASPPPAPSAAPAEADASDAADEGNELAAEAPVPGVRIVGRREPEPAPSAPTTTSTSPPAPSAALPELELQGTSILDGRPVAVISDRRVFEGDFIEGARVLRIEERSVTLELDGQRFTLTF